MRKMRLPVVLPGAFAVLLQAGDASAQVRTWQFGGGGGKVWSEFADTIGIVLADDFTNPSALQPRELDPEVNIVPHLGPWHGYKYPQGHLYRDGQPRIWRGGQQHLEVAVLSPDLRRWRSRVPPMSSIP